MFDENFNVGDVIPDISFFDGGLDYVKFTSTDPAIGEAEIRGFPGFYYLASEDRDVETITKEEVMEQLKIKKVAQVNQECEETILLGFTYLGDGFAFDYKDQDNFTQRLLIMQMNPAMTEVEWKTENNGVKVFSREHFMGIVQAAEQHKVKNIDQYRAIVDAIRNTTFETFEELKRVDFWNPPGSAPPGEGDPEVVHP